MSLRFNHVVTCFLQSDHGILLLRRSGKVGSYQGRWAGVSGYLEGTEDPLQRAKIEIEEEVGLSPAQTSLIRSGETLRVLDEQNDTVWIVHPFLFEVHEQQVRLDWEHTESKWIDPDNLRLYETVPKLKESLERVRWDQKTTLSTFPSVLVAVDEIAKDRVNGASALGRRSVQVLTKVAQTSKANSANELFSNLLAFALELRKAQRSMATIRNLTGKLLFAIDTARQTAGVMEKLVETVRSLCQSALLDAESAVEDASRNSVPFLPEEGYLLTHSYSGTVKRALELAVKSNRNLTVYVTEASPGLEGKQLAKDLIQLNVPVRLIADSAVGSVMADVDTVLVGADSVLSNGSVLNKVGTEKIASIAEQVQVPFFVVCESAKFNTADFLGEPVGTGPLFDITPSEYVSRIITESGSIEPQDVEQQIRKMLSQLYP